MPDGIGQSATADGEHAEVGNEEPEATVLVVDDESVVRESFALYLDPLGYEVRTAGNAEAALAQLDDEVDIALLDRRMPGTSGGEIVEEIRARGLDVRVALVTAVDPDFDIVEIDCDDYLVKPVDKDDLLETIERLAMLDQYNETQREVSSLRVKRNVLEVEKHPDELEDSAEFERLQSRIADLEAELDDLEASFDRHLGYEK